MVNTVFALKFTTHVNWYVNAIFTIFFSPPRLHFFHYICAEQICVNLIFRKKKKN